MPGYRAGSACRRVPGGGRAAKRRKVRRKMPPGSPRSQSMALVRCGSPQVKRFLFCCGPLIHQNLERNDLEPCPKCGQERQLPCGYPPASLPFSFTRDAPALAAVKRLNTKRSTLLAGGMKFLDLPI